MRLLLLLPAFVLLAPGAGQAQQVPRRRPLLTAAADGSEVFVTFSAMRGRDGDWIGVAPVGSPGTQYTVFQYTGPRRAGRLTFEGLPAGDYVARAYFGSSSYRVRAASAPFHVDARQCPPGAAIEAHHDGARTFVRFVGFCGAAQDWIAIAEADSGPEQYAQWVYTGGERAGHRTFDGLPPGRYVARVFFDWAGTRSYEVRAQSVPFTVPEPIGRDLAVAR